MILIEFTFPGLNQYETSLVIFSAVWLIILSYSWVRLYQLANAELSYRRKTLGNQGWIFFGPAIIGYPLVTFIFNSLILANLLSKSEFILKNCELCQAIEPIFKKLTIIPDLVGIVHGPAKIWYESGYEYLTLLGALGVCVLILELFTVSGSALAKISQNRRAEAALTTLAKNNKALCRYVKET